MPSLNLISIILAFSRHQSLVLFLLQCLMMMGAATTNVYAQENFITYTVTKGECYAHPRITGRAHRSFVGSFVLTPDWEQLYACKDRSTHKLFGVKGLGGRNSMRLGVRRAPESTDGLVAVVYTHSKGKIDYGALTTAEGERVVLRYDSLYTCRIEQEMDGWRLTLYDRSGKLLATGFKSLRIPRFLRYKSGIYIEVGNQPSLWTIHTLMREIKGN